MQVVYDVTLKRIVETWGTSDVFPNPGGDISLSPDGNMFVNGAKQGENEMVFTFLNRKTGKFFRSPPVSSGQWTSGDLRIDPAPSWNRTNDQILTTGIAKDGSRQLFILTIRK
jgi:hypothetical protein